MQAHMQTDTAALLLEAVLSNAAGDIGGTTWTPQPGPQTEAYNSDADVIGYGGEAGGGKTDLLLGFASTKHQRSILFRREFPRLEGIVARSRELFAQGLVHANDHYNDSLHRWSLAGGKRTIQFAAMQYEDDKRNFQGRPYDGYLFDELTEFTESQFRFVTAWNRSTFPGQRSRMVVTFNPPMDETQEWVIKYFAPWIDSTHPNPAKDGELRWYAMVDGNEIERPDGEVFENNEKPVQPKSRTFFHASLSDNPILESTGYASQLDALPEPLRSILQGSFSVGRMANPWQVIPTQWIKAAIERGKQTHRPDNLRQSALGADVARGGKDKTVLAPLYGTWFDPLIKYPGIATPNGPAGAAVIVSALKDGAPVGVDVIGIGSSVYDSVWQAGIRAFPFNGSEGTDRRDKSGKLSFRNTRSASWWLFREALDPDNGLGLCLPDDPELLSDLAAPRFQVIGGKIVVESKDDDSKGERKGIKSRLGRSPDCGDSVVIAWWTANATGSYVFDSDKAEQADDDKAFAELLEGEDDE